MVEVASLIVIAVIVAAGRWAWKQVREQRPTRPLAVSPETTERERQRSVAMVRQRLAAAAQIVNRNAQSRAFQTALLQLPGTPDFRRAATVAAAAKLVPVEFRRRQFARFRPNLVEHYRRCTAARTDAGVLLQSLSDLAIALGVASFEAEYIRDVADQAIRRTTTPATPASRLAELKRDHEARVTAIRDGLSREPDVQEPLLEAEESRYRQALEAMFDLLPPADGNAPITTPESP